MVTPAVIPIVVTGAGAPGIRGTVYALRHNPDRQRVYIIGVDVSRDVVGRYMVDAFEQVPPPEHPTYLDEIRRLCHHYSASLLLPQTTREITVLARCREVLRRDGIHAMVSDCTAVHAANDKHALLLAFEEIGLPHPQFCAAHSEDDLVAAARALGYPDVPVVVKPPVSNGMRGVRVLRTNSWDVHRFLSEKPSGLDISMEDLLRILRRGSRWPELVVTDYLPGAEYTVDVFVGQHVKVAVPRLRQHIRSGITFRSETDLRSDLVDYSLRASAHLGLQYAFGFQFKLDNSDVPRILECNPRIQGTMVASSFSGANVIWLGVRELLGDPVTEQPHCTISQFHRFWGGIGVQNGISHEI